MKLSPRSTGAQRLAFARGRLARALETGLELRKTGDLKPGKAIALEAPRNVAPLRDGSLLVLARDGLYRVPAYSEKAERYARPSAFADSALHPDRVHPDRVWLSHSFGDTLYAYDLAAAPGPLLPIAALLELPGSAGNPITTLSSGAFFGARKEGFVEAYSSGKQRLVAGSSADVVRLAGANNVEQVWVFREDGRAELMHVSDRLRRLETIALESPPFDVSVDGTLVGVLMLRQPNDAPKAFVVEVYDEEGNQRLHDEFAAGEAGDSPAALFENACIALSADPPRVAVGGPALLKVWNLGKSPEEMRLPAPAPSATPQ